MYDALNVLMAMNIISKEKKEIRWIGLPTNSAQECQNLEVRRVLFLFSCLCPSRVVQGVGGHGLARGCVSVGRWSGSGGWSGSSRNNPSCRS